MIQNKLWVKRVHINRQLSSIIEKPLRSHNQVMELTKRIDLLLGMKERANGAYYRAYDYNTAINSINLQTESESTTPFATEQIYLD
jgi:hypothetical protein